MDPVNKTFTEFFEGIDWTPLERRETMKFQTAHSPGWEVGKYQTHYEATYRSAYAPDRPDFVAGTVEDMARWLFSKRAYLMPKAE